jgi:hypothetical protein
MKTPSDDYPMKILRIYYAHPVTTYGTELESADLALLKASFPDRRVVIENPSDPLHQQGYTKDGMPYFTRLAQQCDVTAIRCFPGGKHGAGCAAEASAAHSAGKLVLEIGLFPTNAREVNRKAMSIKETKAKIEELRSRAPILPEPTATPTEGEECQA